MSAEPVGRRGDTRSAHRAPRVRDALRSDVPLLLDMIRELAEFERIGEQAVATANDLAASLFDRPGEAGAAIGELDGEPAGFAVWFTNLSTFTGRPGVHLEDIYVRPEARGAGLGKALFRWVARLAVERGAPRLDWAVLDWNEQAHAFYESLGGRELTSWRLYRLEGEALSRLASD